MTCLTGSRRRNALPRSHKRFAVAFFVQLFILFGGFVIIGMLLQGLFSFVQAVFLLVFSIYGIISSSCWMIAHKKEAYEFQTIMGKRLFRASKRVRRRLQERLE